MSSGPKDYPCENCGEPLDKCECAFRVKQSREDWEASVIEDKLQRRMSDRSENDSYYD